jgi:hypothetical protein
MGIKPEDKPKVIGLIVGLAGVLAYVLIALVPKLMAGNQSNQHLDAPPALTAASATSTTAPQTAMTDPSAAIPDDDNLGVPPPPRDSFTPPPTAAKPVMAGQPPLGPKSGGLPQSVSGPAPGLTPIGIAGAPGAPGSLVQGPQAPIKAPLPPIELKGVILGDPAIAVISVNGEVVQRQVGEIIVGDAKVAKIADAGITIVDGKKYVVVTVGHMMQGSGPGLAPAAAPLTQTTALTTEPKPVQ